MHTNSYQVIGVLGLPRFRAGDDLSSAVYDATQKAGVELHDGDIFVVASKVISICEGRRVELSSIVPSDSALALSNQTGKDPRLTELILRESTSHYLATDKGPIIAWHSRGYRLTSAGVDRDGPEHAVLLPEDPDESARRLASTLKDASRRTDLAVIIADSDGRADRDGATSIAIGSWGITPLRTTSSPSDPRSTNQETFVDLLAAAAAVVIGQRGRGVPVAIVRGVVFGAEDNGMHSILHGGPND
jgi:coenzyme F420-0:L-glutamate ligase / coenzyme F420-1:gamma-L-glutamate ligase